MFEIAKWSLALLSLWGVWLNIKRDRSCFVIWSFTNAAWVLVDLYHRVWAQAALMSVYFFLSLYGLREWSRKSK